MQSCTLLCNSEGLITTPILALLVVVCMASVELTRSHGSAAAVLMQQQRVVHGLHLF